MTTIDHLPELDLMAPEFLADPLAGLAAAREQSWAVRTFRGVDILTYDGATEALENEALAPGISKIMEFMGLDPQAMAGPGRSLTFSEGEEHTALRRVVGRWFTPRRVREMTDEVRGLVAGLLDEVSRAGGGEFHAAVAREIPGPVFCWMIGAPVEWAPELVSLSEVLLTAFSGQAADAEAIARCGEQMGAFVAELVDLKRREPADDLMSILLSGADEGVISHDDVHSLAFEMLTASTDNTATTADLIVNQMLLHPGEWKRLRDDRSLVPGAIEETLRIDPKVREGAHHAAVDTSVRDLDIPAGTFVWTNVVAAHNDPAAFPDPLTFDIGRTEKRPQLNFGMGKHYCLGANLARMELEVLLQEMADRWVTIQPDGDPVIERGMAGVKVTSLPIAVTLA